MEKGLNISLCHKRKDEKADPCLNHLRNEAAITERWHVLSQLSLNDHELQVYSLKNKNHHTMHVLTSGPYVLNTPSYIAPFFTFSSHLDPCEQTSWWLVTVCNK